MSENFQQLVEKYKVFYEVSPYQTLFEERHGSATATGHIIHAGFDVDIHGVSDTGELRLPPPSEYALGYAQLKRIADTVSQAASECYIEVISFPSSVFSEARRHFQPEAVIRIRISHRGLDQPVGPPEQHALEEIEKQLLGLGVPRR